MSEVTVKDRRWAERITELLKVRASRMADAYDSLKRTIEEARDGGAAELMGYASWTAYVSDVFKDNPLVLERGQRKEITYLLADQGMSTRAIAPIVGASQKTVSRDVRESFDSPEPAAPVERVVIAEQRHVSIDTGEPTEPEPAPEPAPRQVTGLDGKTYTPPAAQPKPNRPALPSQYAGAIVELDKALARIERLHRDDRFNANKKNVAPTHESDVQRAIDRLKTLRDQLK